MSTRSLLFVPLLLAACSTPEQAEVDLAGPIPFAGGSVQAPPGDGWKLISNKTSPDSDEAAIVFERVLGPGHRLTAMATLFPYEFTDLEECRESLHRSTYVETATHRDPRGNVRVVADAVPPYVQVIYGAEEADSIGPNAKWSTLTSEFRWFLRPGDNRGLMLSFNEQRPSGTKPAEYGAQATLFFQSLRLAKPADGR